MKIGRPKEVPDEQILAVARKCFLERGGSISAVEIGRAVGVSHATLFNRFGSKQGLVLAALGPPKDIAWIDTLDKGPDGRPMKVQLVEVSLAIAAFFRDLQAGFSILQAAGISLSKTCSQTDDQAAPVRAFQGLTRWIERAQGQGKIAPCDAGVLASTLLGVLHNRAFSGQLCGDPDADRAADSRHVADVIDLLWNGLKPPPA